MEKQSKILITGAHGVVGTALKEVLDEHGFDNVITPTREVCDFTDFKSTLTFFETHQPDYVFHLAAAVFGIMGNMNKKGWSFLHNVLINTHVIEACRMVQVKKVVAMGTVAAYPAVLPTLPATESMIWQGSPHASEDSYGHAKRAMLAQLNAYHESYDLKFAFVISTNLYGPNDKFDIQHGHVIPSLIRKFYEAKQSGQSVTVWGNGSGKRDFLYASDAAGALMTIMEKIEGPINMASGTIHTIKELVNYIASSSGVVSDEIIWDTSKSNGRVDGAEYDLSKLFAAGFRPKITLQEGIKRTYDWYAVHSAVARK